MYVQYKHKEMSRQRFMTKKVKPFLCKYFLDQTSTKKEAFSLKVFLSKALLNNSHSFKSVWISKKSTVSPYHSKVLTFGKQSF